MERTTTPHPGWKGLHVSTIRRKSVIFARQTMHKLCIMHHPSTCADSAHYMCTYRLTNTKFSMLHDRMLAQHTEGEIYCEVRATDLVNRTLCEGSLNWCAMGMPIRKVHASVLFN